MINSPTLLHENNNFHGKHWTVSAKKHPLRQINIFRRLFSAFICFSTPSKQQATTNNFTFSAFLWLEQQISFNLYFFFGCIWCDYSRKIWYVYLRNSDSQTSWLVLFISTNFEPFTLIELVIFDVYDVWRKLDIPNNKYVGILRVFIRYLWIMLPSKYLWFICYFGNLITKTFKIFYIYDDNMWQTFRKFLGWDWVCQRFF